jgi:FkbM family methyltransferase
MRTRGYMMERKIHVFDNGLKVYNDHLTHVQRQRYKRHNVHEAEEENIFNNIIRAIPANGCYIDIGSAIGYYPLLAKRLSPGLIICAIEPLERHHAFFMENIALNGFIQNDFIIYTEGISLADGEAKFVDEAYGSSIQRNRNKGHSVKIYIKTFLSFIGLQKTKNIITIKTITLDNMLKRIKKPVDLCQMDVQGFELDVLRGARHSLQAGSIRTFLIGTHGKKQHQGCIELLNESGYMIGFEDCYTKEQPDGILVAGKDINILDHCCPK